MKRYIKSYTEGFDSNWTDDDWDNLDLATIIREADVKNPIAKRPDRNKKDAGRSRGPYRDGMNLTLWDGNQEVVDSTGYAFSVESIPEGEPAHKADLKLMCIDSNNERLAIFKDANGRIYYYQVAPNSNSKLMRIFSKGKTYALSCSVIDIPEGVAANGLTYIFKCSWITKIYVTKNLKDEIEDVNKADAQLMRDLYGSGKKEFFN